LLPFVLAIPFLNVEHGLHFGEIGANRTGAAPMGGGFIAKNQ
jgi:hypothetical protein